MKLSEELAKLTQQFEQKRQARDDAAALRKAMREKTYSQPCVECGNAFKPARHWQRFCSDSCRYANRTNAGQRQIAELERELAFLLEENERLRARIADLEA